MFQLGNTYGKGRPKGSKRNEICKAYAEKYGFKKLIAIAEGKGHRYREYNGRLVEVGPDSGIQFEALKLILAYGFGKPTESIDLSTGGESLADWAIQHFRRNGNHVDSESNGSVG